MTEKLGEILRGLDYGIGKSIELSNSLAAWGEIVDVRVSQHTEAVKISNKTLFIKTSSAAWANELTFLKPAFISKFNQRVGKAVIEDIRFQNA